MQLPPKSKSISVYYQSILVGLPIEWLLFLQWLERYYSPHPIFSHKLHNPTLKFVGPSIYRYIGLSVGPSISLSVCPSHFTLWCFCGLNFSTTLIVPIQVVPVGTDFVYQDVPIFMALWLILFMATIYLITRHSRCRRPKYFLHIFGGDMRRVVAMSKIAMGP